MIDLSSYQDTHAGAFFASIEDEASTFAEATGVATRSSFEDLIRPVPRLPGLVGSALSKIQRSENPEMGARARDLLLTIEDVLEVFQQKGIDLSYLPAFYISDVGHEYILVEWIFNDFRLGFSVDSDPNDSSWYLVSGKSLGSINAFGYIPEVDLGRLLFWLLHFAILNS